MTMLFAEEMAVLSVGAVVSTVSDFMPAFLNFLDVFFVCGGGCVDLSREEASLADLRARVSGVICGECAVEFEDQFEHRIQAQWSVMGLLRGGRIQQ